MALQWVQYANLSVQQQFEASPLSCTSLCYFGWLLVLGRDQFIWRLSVPCQGESVLPLLDQMRQQDLRRKVHLSSESIQPSNL